MGRKATCDLLLPLRTRGGCCPEHPQAQAGRCTVEGFFPIILLGDTGNTDPAPGTCSDFGTAGYGGEDKPGKAPQTLLEWKVSLLGWIWFSHHWGPALPAQGGTLWPQSPGQWPQPLLLPDHGTSGSTCRWRWSRGTAQELLLFFLTQILHLFFL